MIGPSSGVEGSVGASSLVMRSHQLPHSPKMGQGRMLIKREEGGGEVVFFQGILQEVLQSRIRPDESAATLVRLPFFLAEL